MSCYWCKIAIGVLITIILIAAVAAILSSGGGAFPVWTAAVAKIGGLLGISGAGLKTLGYTLFSIILGAGAAAIHLLHDIIDWILCEICKLLGKCEECKSPF